MNPAAEANGAPAPGRTARARGEARWVVGDELLMGRFRVLERIGAGGMGTVYRAFDERLQREVALKEIETAEPQRVLREAQAAARLNHPGIVTLYELGERDGSAVLVTELVPGTTLARLAAEGSLSDRDVGELAADLCDALAHAHARGVVHRDVKPQNVIVRDDQGAGRRAKLMDFGIARVAGAPTVTATGEVVGTLAYMAPEQLDGRPAGSPADVYSLALTAFECWAGVNPVAGANPAHTVRRIELGGESLRAHRPDLPPGLTEAVDASLDPEPDRRPTALELRDALEREIDGLDPGRLPPRAEPDADGRPAARLAAPRLAALACLAGLLALTAGPLAAPGLALVLAVLCAPALLAGAPAAALLAPAAPAFAAAGIGSAAAALGAAGATPLARALLGAAAWAWLLAGSLALGLGPQLGIAAEAPAGWASDAGLAAEAVLAPLVGLESLLGMAIFALAAAALGWLLGARHVSVALLGAMLWAAAVDAALAAVGNGALGNRPIGVIAAALTAVALEFTLAREAEPGWATARGRGRPRAQTT